MTRRLRSDFQNKFPLLEDGVFDPLRIADIHRRGLYDTDSHLIARATRDSLLELGVALSYRVDALLGKRHKAAVSRVIALQIADLATRAKFAGAESILLPFQEEGGLSDDVRSIIQDYNIDFKFDFRSKPYAQNLSKTERVAAFNSSDPLYLSGHQGIVCGFWYIDENLKESWKAEEDKEIRAAQKMRHG